MGLSLKNNLLDFPIMQVLQQYMGMTMAGRIRAYLYIVLRLATLMVYIADTITIGALVDCEGNLWKNC